MKALHFGAGNIGRGFIGKLLADAGVELTFADVNQTVLDLLNSRKSYQVHVVGEQERVESVNNVSAVNSGSEAAVALIAEADLVTTAVGPQILGKIAGTIAKGLVLRHQQGNEQPLNIIACENMVRGTSQLKQHVLAALPQDEQAWVEQHVGFVDSAVDRIVPPADSSDPLEVTVETFSEWIVDQTQFKGQPPAIAGMELTDNLMAFVERKLFTLNTGHAITAYLGQRAGLQTIRDAILDPAIRRVVKGAMEESGAVLIKRYGFDADKHAAYINKILGRFETRICTTTSSAWAPAAAQTERRRSPDQTAAGHAGIRPAARQPDPGHRRRHELPQRTGSAGAGVGGIAEHARAESRAGANSSLPAESEVVEEAVAVYNAMHK